MIMPFKMIMGYALIIGAVLASFSGNPWALPMVILGYLLVIDGRLDRLEEVLGFSLEAMINKSIEEVEEELDESKNNS